MKPPSKGLVIPVSFFPVSQPLKEKVIGPESLMLVTMTGTQSTLSRHYTMSECMTGSFSQEGHGLPAWVRSSALLLSSSVTLNKPSCSRSLPSFICYQENEKSVIAP